MGFARIIFSWTPAFTAAPSECGKPHTCSKSAPHPSILVIDAITLYDEPSASAVVVDGEPSATAIVVDGSGRAAPQMNGTFMDLRNEVQ